MKYLEALSNKKNRRLILVIFLVFIAFVIGRFTGSGNGSTASHDHEGASSESVSSWTCSMHPQIQQPEPGQCPLCGMDLIPVQSTGGEELGFRQIKLSQTAQKLAAVQVAPVERKFVTKEIRMVGKIDYDETSLKYITAWIPGRIEQMFVDYTGTPVKQGDHLVKLYSPDLLATQQELIQAVKSVRSSGSEMMTQNLNAIRERLRLWGLTQQQINEIENMETVTDQMTIYAPAGGIVVEKTGVEGMYVQTGTILYTIADLTHLWIQLEAYESDVPWLRYGQEVFFASETYPGDSFSGKIVFIDPVLDEKTRTVNVRVNIENPDGKLKPGMFVRAVVKSNIAAGGRVMDAALAGKWISPMHPEIVKDGPGKCDVCGMDLVPVESLGYISSDKIAKEASLVVPATAPLITGKRAVVYVQVPGKEGVFEGREIILGPRAGDYYIVKEGLQEGELVVVNGNFKIDSAVQIVAKPSMMNPYGGNVSKGHNHE
jgi:Cu(I)/Ag(I) efflux system membrane fusion protein